LLSPTATGNYASKNKSRTNLGQPPQHPYMTATKPKRGSNST